MSLEINWFLLVDYFFSYIFWLFHCPNINFGRIGHCQIKNGGQCFGFNFCNSSTIHFNQMKIPKTKTIAHLCFSRSRNWEVIIHAIKSGDFYRTLHFKINTLRFINLHEIVFISLITIKATAPFIRKQRKNQ